MPPTGDRLHGEIKTACPTRGRNVSAFAGESSPSTGPAPLIASGSPTRSSTTASPAEKYPACRLDCENATLAAKSASEMRIHWRAINGVSMLTAKIDFPQQPSRTANARHAIAVLAQILRSSNFSISFPGKKYADLAPLARCHQIPRFFKLELDQSGFGAIRLANRVVALKPVWSFNSQVGPFAECVEI